MTRPEAIGVLCKLGRAVVSNTWRPAVVDIRAALAALEPSPADTAQSDMFTPTPAEDDARLYGGHAPAVAGSDTSEAAATTIKDYRAGKRGQVYRFLCEQGPRGATDDEIDAALAMPANTSRVRRVELVELGRVVDSGARRATRTGSPAVVWVGTGEGV